MDLKLLAVSVGMPAPLGVWQGEPVVSGIRKTPLVVGRPSPSAKRTSPATAKPTSPSTAVPTKRSTSTPPITGRGGKRDANFVVAPASFGENLTVEGADEHTVRIGDRFAWGAVVLEVSQPRAPCYKFTMLTGREDMGARMTVSARTGWYVRVLETGEAPTTGASSARRRTKRCPPSATLSSPVITPACAATSSSECSPRRCSRATGATES